MPPCLPLPISLLYNLSPHSYTTDHTAELLIPGNPHLLQRVLDLLLSFPAVRLAEPGEFTARAHLAGRLTLEQAEGVAAIIAADRDDELEAARDLLEGRTGDRYRTWTDTVATLLALVEAGIDFTDQEDVVPIPPADLAQQLDNLRADLTAHAGDPREQPATLPTVALVGPPSAGKSTLFNALLGRHRAVTHETPGTTRDALAEPLDLSIEHPGTQVTLLDLPGLDLAPSSPLDRAAQTAAIDAASRADLLLHCDPTGRFTQDPRLPANKPTLRIRTKADLPGPNPTGPDATDSSTPDALAICALDGFHLPALRRAIADHAHAASAAGAVVPRHARALAAAAAALADAIATVDPAAHALPEPELTAGALRAALDELGSITGAVTPDEVIGRVFATFCVGK